MKAIILAAGRGKRLKEFTESKPKCLNVVGGRTLLDWQIKALKDGGVQDILLVTGYRGEAFSDYDVRQISNRFWERTNMLNSLLCAQNEFDMTTIVSYSDIIYRSQVVSELCATDEDAVVVYDRDWLNLWKKRFSDPLNDAETFSIDKQGLIREIGLTPSSVSEVEGQYLGLMKFTPRAFGWIVKWSSGQSGGVDHTDMTTMIRGLIESGYPIYGLGISGGWCEIDTPKDLSIANAMYETGDLKF